MNAYSFQPRVRHRHNFRIERDDTPQPPRWPLHREGDAMLLARIYVRYQAEQLSEVASRVLEQHRRREALGAPVSLDQASVLCLGSYIEKLQSVAEQIGFPYNVEWPEVPACLRQHIIT